MAVQYQVAQLRMTKDLIKAGFPLRQARNSVPPGRGRMLQRRWLAAALAASLSTVIVSFGAGLLSYRCADSNRAEKILLHLDNPEPERFGVVLNYAEAFLRQHGEAGARVDVVANAGGIELLRKGVSPYETRMLRLMRQYPNLHFVACANSVRQLQATGNEVLMITDVHSDATAVDHIVSRLGEGWSYRKIDHLSGV
jgi:intracellular sulfur oxidation DsrE/DsrF family protein